MQQSFFLLLLVEHVRCPRGYTRPRVVSMPELPDVTVYVERLGALAIGRPLEAIRSEVNE